jgi:site-specific DNA recombinase
MAKRNRKTHPVVTGIAKRAAIYVRVSSERQARKKNKESGEIEELASPIKQEQRCLELCQRNGYAVVEVYRDTEKYRVGKRMVEPSGSRADRPQFKRMLADAHEGRFDLVVAFRSDRLFRNYKSMGEFDDCISNTGIDCKLVTEHFDKRMMGAMAFASKIELDAKHDRFMLGVSGRLEKGKVWNNPPAYGWKRVEGRLELEPTEAQWVRQVWQWYADGITAREIRRRLIAGGAPERRTDNKTPWSTSYIYVMLHRDAYHTGKFTMQWDGDTYAIEVPVIVPSDLAARVKAKMKKKQAYPARNVQYNYLGAGLLYCAACDVRMSARTVNRPERKSGVRSEYACFRGTTVGHDQPGCAKTVSVKALDHKIWAKFWSLFDEPGRLEAAIATRVMQLQAQSADADAEASTLEQELDDLMMRRQMIIGWAERKMITEQDMALRLAGLEIEQLEKEKSLNKARLLTGNQAERLLEAAREYRESVLVGAVGINDEPQTDEQAQAQFRTRRKLLEGLVTRIDLRPGHDLTIHTEFDFAKLVQDSVMSTS